MCRKYNAREVAVIRARGSLDSRRSMHVRSRFGSSFQVFTNFTIFFSRFFSSVVDCLKIIERVATTCDKVGAIICEGKRGDFHSLAEGCRSESSANFEHSVP